MRLSSGQAWAAAETLLAFLENCVVIKERQVTIRLDFYEEKPRKLNIGVKY